MVMVMVMVMMMVMVMVMVMLMLMMVMVMVSKLTTNDDENNESFWPSTLRNKQWHQTSERSASTQAQHRLRCLTPRVRSTRLRRSNKRKRRHLD